MRGECTLIVDVLYSILVAPVVLVIELAFTFAYRALGNPGAAIVCVSIVVGVLTMPLYRMADRLQRRERARQKRMERWVNQINARFKGDERYMMLSTYYREQGYKPVYALSSSISLLLQVPIFIAAYSFLSSLDVLVGASFLGLPDLSQPDGLIALGNGTTINLMPLLMTVLNCVSTFVYTRDAPLRDRLQAYGLALLFLVLLYQSPSGLVLYWTCNQVFSLVRNVVDVVRARKGFADNGPAHSPEAADRRHRRRMSPAPFLLAATLAALITGVLIPSAFMAASPIEFIDASGFDDPISFIGYTACVAFGFFVLWAGIFYFLADPKAKRAIACVLACLDAAFAIDYFAFGEGMGVVSANLVYDNIPSYDVGSVVVNLLVVAGAAALVALLWAKQRQLVVPALAVTSMAVAALALPNFIEIAEAAERSHSIASDTASLKADPAALTGDIAYRRGSFDPIVRGATNVAAELPSVMLEERVPEIIAERVAAEAAEREEQERASLGSPRREFEFDEEGYPEPIVELSKEGRNVVVLFLDRAIGAYVPYIFDEVPGLEETYDGFTYYPNAISFGGNTVMGAPAIYGGYDYSVAGMNLRDDLSMATKYDEALSVLPMVLSGYGFDTTYVDPPYVDFGYDHDPISLSGVPGLSVYYTENALFDFYLEHGSYAQQSSGEDEPSTLDADLVEASRRTVMQRGLVYYAMMLVSPVGMRPVVYDGGSYLSPDNHSIADTLGAEEGPADGVAATAAETLATWATIDLFDRVGDVLGESTNLTGIDDSEYATRSEDDMLEGDEGAADVSDDMSVAAEADPGEDARYLEGADRMGTAGAFDVTYEFLRWYAVLADLPYLTEVSDGEASHLSIVRNLATHTPELLQKPDYEPELYLDNTAYPEPVYRLHDGRALKLASDAQVKHFHANVASLKRIGEWLEYLKEQGVYDNTRIILVSDHGRGLSQFEDLRFSREYDGEWHSALLMVKDFGAHGFSTSYDFMTTGDTPTLVLKDIAPEAASPFTGTVLDGHDKYEHRQLVSSSYHWEPEYHNENSFNLDDAFWYSITGDIYDKRNWRYEGEGSDFDIASWLESSASRIEAEDEGA